MKAVVRPVAIVVLGLAGLAAQARAAAAAESTTLAIPAENLGFISRYVAEDEGLWKQQGST
jgi:ABC-type nitrate/sulfonate/bicarbonate transport system substrate-binding protein